MAGKKKSFLEMSMEEKDGEITRRKSKGVALTKEMQAYMQGYLDSTLKRLAWQKANPTPTPQG